MDLHEMARQAHATNTRQDGGPGSGPQMGSGGKTEIKKKPVKMVSLELPKTRSRVTIQQAEHALKQKGYTQGPPAYNHKTKSMEFTVSKGGKTSKLTSKELKNLIYS